MLRMKVAVLMEDADTLNRFVNLLSSKFSDQLEVYAFSDQKKALNAIIDNNINFFMIDNEIKINKDDVPKMCTMIYLTETKNSDEIDGVKAICMYQRPEMIYNELLAIFAENTVAVGNVGDKDSASKIYTFLSPVGGVGTSTVAAAFAVYLAQNSRKVLYINIEKNGDASAYFSGDGMSDFGDIMYDIKSKKQNLAIRIESKVKHDSTGVYFIESSKNALDALFLTEKDVELLLTSIAELKMFDDIIVDTDCSMDKKMTTLMKLSDNTIIVNDGKDISNAKIYRFSAAIAALETENEESYIPKLCLFLNKFNGKRSSYDDNDIKWSILGGMDDYYGESSRQIMQRIVRSNIFDYFFYAKK